MRRAEVEEWWVAYAEARVTQEDVHTWADRRIRETDEMEPLALSGLEELHGLSGRNFKGPNMAISERLTRWRDDCAAYDRDPEAFRRERMELARRGLGIDHPRLS